MLATLFRSKFDLERNLAVERCRREIAEADARDWRALYERLEVEHGRLIDATLLKQGVIHAPLRTEPSKPANPLASVIGQLGITEIEHRLLSKPPMSDS